MNEVVQFGHQAFSVAVEATLWDTTLRYAVEVDYDVFGDGEFRVNSEELSKDASPVYDCYRDGQHLVLDVGDLEERVYPMRSSDPYLSHAAPTYWPPGETTALQDPTVDLKDTLGNMRFLDLVPDRMREPAFPGAKLGDSGQNLAVALESICIEPERRNVLVSWAQELTPMDVEGFEFPRDSSGRVILVIRERNGRKVSAYSASDGTLRFLAILAALLGPNPAGVYFFEEIDNGIHPNRLWLLLELIEKQTAKNGTQVITTAHSPALLSWIRDEAFENTSIVYRDEYWSDSVIRPVADLYDLRELRKSRTLGELHTEGWLETAMKFKEGNADTEHLDEKHGEAEEDRL